MPLYAISGRGENGGKQTLMQKPLGRRDVLRMGAAAGATCLYGIGNRETASAEEKSRLTINIVNQSGNANLTIQELLKQQGYLEQYGVEAKTLVVADGSKITAALIG